MTAPDVVLVGCVKSKRSGTRRADVLYNSPLFRGRRAYAESFNVPWFILSALYGLVAPDAAIATYDATLKRMTAEDRRMWSARVLGELTALMPTETRTVEIHAGKEYREFGLTAALEARGIEDAVPLAALGLGKQLAWYKARRFANR